MPMRQIFKRECVALVLIFASISTVYAVSNEELEALEQQIQAKELEQIKKAENEAKRKEEAKRRAAEEARLRAEEKARRKAEEEEEKRLQEELARQAELEAQRKEEQARLRAEQEAEAKRLAEEEKMQAEIEAKLKAEAEKKRAEAKEKRIAEEALLKKAKEDLLAGEMVFVEGGTFIMGESLSYEDNHEVTVSSFSIGKYEVTIDQWLQVMGNNPSKFKDCGGCPVGWVSWDDVQKFIQTLNRKTGSQFRLPTEAEWEYACRSGGKSEKYCGGDNADAVGWYNNNSRNRIRSVGEKQANGLGIHDMSGNIGEWMQDCWNDSYSGAPTDGSAWMSGNCNNRVFRGGSWYHESRYLISASRLKAHRVNRVPIIGFRLAKSE